MAETPGLNSTTSVLYIDISPEDYKILIETPLNLATHCGGCPRCKSPADWKVHAKYHKYWCTEALPIVRLRCLHCRRTHAVIPSFSQPHSSHSTQCIDSYLAKRHAGLARRQAAEGLSLEAFSYQTLKRLDKRLQVRALQMKAARPTVQSAQGLQGYSFFKVLTASHTPVATLNRHCMLEAGKGWLFGNIAWLCQRRYAGTMVSHDLANVPQESSFLNSS